MEFVLITVTINVLESMETLRYALPRAPSSTETGLALRRLATLLLAYAVFLTVVATLAPFRFELPARLSLGLHVDAHDLALNLLLLLPAGFLVSLMRSPPSLGPQAVSPPGSQSSFRAFQVFCMGALLSLVLEGLQEFLPSRFSSLIDVLANATGAFIGALLFELLRPWVSRSLRNELTVRLPLSHLFYLLTLLLLIDSLMAKANAQRLWLMLPLAIAGVLLIAAIYTHRIREQQRVAPSRIALAAGLWIIVAGLPGWLRSPGLGLLTVSITVALCYLLCVTRFPRTRSRRFEQPTLVAVTVPLAIYLVGLFLASPLSGPAAYNDQLDFDTVEILAAFTVAGYGLAEMLGRRGHSDRSALLLSGFIACLIGASIELAASTAFGLTPRSWLFPGTALFALWGAAIYRAELRVVQALASTEPNKEP